MLESKEWTETLKQRGWEDFYLAGEPFAAFLKSRPARIVIHIREGGLAIGTHLTAQELAERFSVSRFSVGQALQLLAFFLDAVRRITCRFSTCWNAEKCGGLTGLAPSSRTHHREPSGDQADPGAVTV